MKKFTKFILAALATVSCAAFIFVGCDEDNAATGGNETGGATSPTMVTEAQWMQAFTNSEQVNADGVKYFGADNYDYTAFFYVNTGVVSSSGSVKMVTESGKTHFKTELLGNVIEYYLEFNGGDTLNEYMIEDGSWVVEEKPLQNYAYPSTDDMINVNFIDDIASYSVAQYDEETQSYKLKVNDAQITLDGFTYTVSLDMDVRFLNGKVNGMTYTMGISCDVGQYAITTYIDAEFTVGGQTVTLPQPGAVAQE